MTSLSLRGIARALGGKVVGSTVRCPGPGHSRFDDSLVVFLADNDDGFNIHSHAGDDFRECKDHVRERLGLDAFGGGKREIDPLEIERRSLARRDVEEAAAQNARSKLIAALAVWNNSLPLLGSLAERYLKRRLLGRAVDPAVYEGAAIRFCPVDRLPPHFRDLGRGAAGTMIALMTAPLGGTPTGIHLTFVTADSANLKEERGSKVLSVRRMWGRQGVVRLWPDSAVNGGLAVGEGIETVLAGVVLTNRAPAWAALDAGGVQGLPPMPGVEALTIFVDNDASRTGAIAAEHCTKAWSASGATVSLITPRGTGQDMNDCLDHGEAAVG